MTSTHNQAPQLGRFVHYMISQVDAQQINRRRDDARSAALALGGATQDGTQKHMGNMAVEGDVYPALIVKIWGGATRPPQPGDSCNLQVFLDGSDTFWATSRHEGDEPGEWTWPVIA